MQTGVGLRTARFMDEDILRTLSIATKKLVNDYYRKWKYRGAMWINITTEDVKGTMSYVIQYRPHIPEAGDVVAFRTLIPL